MSAADEGLDPEKVAYWYFRLNGFLQIENFVIHPAGRGGQRTDADLLAVRFPFRAERLIDDPDDIMADDTDALALSATKIDVAIVEVKTNEPCKLNGPWTDPDRRNLERVLAAIGCLERHELPAAAADLYEGGLHEHAGRPRVRLIALGGARNHDLARRYPSVVQLSWREVLSFIWGRFRTYRRQKAQVDQWDPEGLRLKALADRSPDEETFVRDALGRMGVRDGPLEQRPTGSPTT